MEKSQTALNTFHEMNWEEILAKDNSSHSCMTGWLVYLPCPWCFCLAPHLLPVTCNMFGKGIKIWPP